MQITSVRYRELVSLRGCERKALEAEATVGPGEAPEHACCILAAVCAYERELTPWLFCASENAFEWKLLPSLGNDLAFGFRRVGVFFRKGEMPSSRCLIATRRRCGFPGADDLNCHCDEGGWLFDLAVRDLLLLGEVEV